MPQVIIVDESNTVIWHKEKSEVKAEDIFRVAACIIKNSEWKYLLAQRSLQKENKPWLWAYAAEGTLTQNEGYESNILLKLESEIGLTEVLLEKLYQKRRYGVHTFFHEVYFMKLDQNIEGFQFDRKQVEKMRWFTKEEILEKEFEGNLISKKLQRDVVFLEDGVESEY